MEWGDRGGGLDASSCGGDVGFDGGGVNVSLTTRLGFAWTASDGELGGGLF